MVSPCARQGPIARRSAGTVRTTLGRRRAAAGRDRLPSDLFAFVLLIAGMVNGTKAAPAWLMINLYEPIVTLDRAAGKPENTVSR